jgi:hypothetical protein
VVLNKNQSDHREPSGITRVRMVNSMNLWQELAWLVLILIAGLVPRFIFITSFPSHPISDFLSILDFSILLRDDWLAKNAWQWQFLSPGLPLILSGILRFVRGSPEAIGRWATAFTTGLVPVLPYIFWKDVFRLRTRIFAALLLALWPGQILFSSVLAQDNWIIFPTVALSVLAVRTLVTKKDGYPILAALLYAVTVAIRQEMMVALLPAAVIAILGGRAEKHIRNFFIGSSIVGVVFAALILQRGLATGRYTLTTEHLGKSVLGSYIPGAGMGWIDPLSYVETVHPELVETDVWGTKFVNERGALNLAWQEFLHRPTFHAIRIFGLALTNLFEMDQQNLRWSLEADEVLPNEYAKDARNLMNTLGTVLQDYPPIVNMFFACSIFFALSQRYLLKWISPILATIVLKFGLHAVLGSQPRYFLIIIALELLTIAIITEVSFRPQTWEVSIRSLIIGVLCILVLAVLASQASNYVLTHDQLPQSTYFYPLEIGGGQIECTKQGQMISPYGQR